MPLSSYLVNELKRYKQSIDTERDDLFYDGEVNHIAKAKFSSHFRELFKKIGMNGISFHSLRHTNATKVVEIIQDVSIASKMLGHANLNTTMTYIHQGMDAKKEAVEKFTNHILSLTEYELGTKQKTA